MPRDGFEVALVDDEGRDNGSIRVRRCYGDRPDGEEEVEVVELTFETFTPHWFLTSICLKPAAALVLGTCLNHEGGLPMGEESLIKFGAMV